MYCGTRGCDVQGVAGVTALVEVVMLWVLQGYFVSRRCVYIVL